MTRRDFLKSALASSFYLAARRIFPAALATAPADVGIATGFDYQKAVAAAVDLVGNG